MTSAGDGKLRSGTRPRVCPRSVRCLPGIWSMSRGCPLRCCRRRDLGSGRAWRISWPLRSRRGWALILVFWFRCRPCDPMSSGTLLKNGKPRLKRQHVLRPLLRTGIQAGALGFSTTVATQQVWGFKGRPLACRLASRDELRAYAHVLRDLGRGAIEVNLGGAGSSILAVRQSRAD